MNSNEKQKGYKFLILNEDVATQDLFEDKTHERVSENLYQIFAESSKGVTIGLEGSWGSGKSTVIKLLKNKLAQDVEGKNLFFMFDAWAHEGDPLRRIFLESLIRAIDPQEKSFELKKIKEKINGRKKTVVVKAKKSASRLGKFISLSALLLPLGSAFLGKVNYEKLFWPWSPQAHSLHSLFIFGFLLCLAPMFVLAYWYFFGDKGENGEITWEFFAVDSKEDYTQDITEDGERTSIEFEDYFQVIFQTSMSEGLINKSIIVVDNLDRVDPTHAKNIWATLQTFFQKRSNGYGDQDWQDKLWFIIPFDREGFIKIWGSNDTNNEVAASFLKKCFQLIAEVPQPVMSAWSEYAKKSIDEALAQWPESERQIIYSTYTRYQSRLDTSPTPRDVKSTVNQIGMLGAIWGGSVSSEAICLYALLKNSLSSSDLRRELIEGKVPMGSQSISDGKEIRAELAGLLFGVHRTKGIQLLLGPEIKEAFNSGNGETLSSLVKSYGEAFWIAYEDSKKEWILTYSHTEEYKIEFTKAFHFGLLGHKDKLWRDIKTISRAWMDSFPAFDFSKTDYSHSMSQIIELSIDATDFLDSLQKYSANELQQIVLKVGKPEFSENALKNLISINNVLKANGRELSQRHYENLNSQNWRIWIDALERIELKIDAVLPQDRVIAELAREAQFSSDSLDIPTITYLTKSLKVYPNSLDWKSVVGHVISWFNRPSRSFDCPEIYELAIAFFSICQDDVLSNIRECVSGPAFWESGQSLSLFQNQNLSILAAISLKDKLQEKSYVLSTVKSFWVESTDDETLKSIFNRLTEFKQTELVWMLCRDERNKLAIEIVRKSSDVELYSNWAGATYIDEFEWCNSSERDEIARKLIQHGAFFAIESEMKGKSDLYQTVYKIFYAVGDPKVCTFIDSEVNQLSKDDWLKCLSSESDLIYLVDDKNHYFSDAITEFLIDLVNGKSEIISNSKFTSQMPSLLSKVADLERVFIPNLLRAYFNVEKDNLNEEFFNLISPFFHSHLKELDEKLIMMRLNYWIDQNQASRIRWLMEYVHNPFSAPLESLISRVKSGMMSNESMKLEIASLINDHFNLGVVIEKPQDVDIIEKEEAQKANG